MQHDGSYRLMYCCQRKISQSVADKNQFLEYFTRVGMYKWCAQPHSSIQHKVRVLGIQRREPSVKRI